MAMKRVDKKKLLTREVLETRIKGDFVTYHRSHDRMDTIEVQRRDADDICHGNVLVDESRRPADSIIYIENLIEELEELRDMLEEEAKK